MDILSIALGGGIGAVLRYEIGNIVGRSIGSQLPYATFIINIIGCLLMGLLMTCIVDRGLLSVSWRLFLCVGLLGGFTTFSSFGYETLTLLWEGNLLAATSYAALSVVLGVMAAGIGCLIARAI